MDDLIVPVINTDPIFAPVAEPAELLGKSRAVHVVKIQTADMILAVPSRMLVMLDQIFKPLAKDVILMPVNHKFKLVAEFKILVDGIQCLTPRFSLFYRMHLS